MQVPQTPLQQPPNASNIPGIPGAPVGVNQSTNLTAASKPAVSTPQPQARASLQQQVQQASSVHAADSTAFNAQHKTTSQASNSGDAADLAPSSGNGTKTAGNTDASQDVTSTGKKDDNKNNPFELPPSVVSPHHIRDSQLAERQQAIEEQVIQNIEGIWSGPGMLPSVPGEGNH